MPLKVFPQDAEVCLLHNIPREDRTGGRKEEMAASQVHALFGPGAVSGFLWKCLD